MPSSPAARVERPRRDAYSLEELLDVVVRVFIERGYDATSMEDLARATGRTKSSIYHHVDGKEHLLSLALSRAVDALSAVLEQHATGPGSPVDRLERVVRGSVQVLVEQLPYVTLLLRVRGNTDVERDALERRRSFDRRLSALVEEAIAAGEVRSDLDPRVVTRLLFGMVNSLTEWWRPGGEHGPQDVEDALVAFALDGVRARRPG